MKATRLNQTVIESYLRLIEKLSEGTKLAIIAKINKSLAGKEKNNTTALYNSFGSWKSKKSAEQIIDELRSSRNFNRKIEKL